KGWYPLDIYTESEILSSGTTSTAMTSKGPESPGILTGASMSIWILELPLLVSESSPPMSEFLSDEGILETA
ncbi:hypothetical protein ASPCADRAFT_207638, partial [Aspergillus carbonarius ITEM 5010]